LIDSVCWLLNVHISHADSGREQVFFAPTQLSIFFQCHSNVVVPVVPFLPHSCIFSPSFLFIFSLIPVYFQLKKNNSWTQGSWIFFNKKLILDYYFCLKSGPMFLFQIFIIAPLPLPNLKHTDSAW
jgi:hypothetical protein